MSYWMVWLHGKPHKWCKMPLCTDLQTFVLLGISSWEVIFQSLFHMGQFQAKASNTMNNNVNCHKVWISFVLFWPVKQIKRLPLRRWVMFWNGHVLSRLGFWIIIQGGLPPCWGFKHCKSSCEMSKSMNLPTFVSFSDAEIDVTPEKVANFSSVFLSYTDTLWSLNIFQVLDLGQTWELFEVFPQCGNCYKIWNADKTSSWPPYVVLTQLVLTQWLLKVLKWESTYSIRQSLLAPANPSLPPKWLTNVCKLRKFIKVCSALCVYYLQSLKVESFDAFETFQGQPLSVILTKLMMT